MDIRDQRRNAPPSQIRSNEYFVPKDGIDREVITADICRYLGNDALVRPGTYENPVTKMTQQGYYVTAYRNLTSAMIADLKADSQRWEQERRVANTRAGYTQSQTHESRQQWGPSGESNPSYPTGPISTPFMPQENHYIAGSNMGVDQSRGIPAPINPDATRVSAPQYVPVPPSQQYSNQMPNQNYGRGVYNQPPPPPIPNPRRGREDPNFITPIIPPPSSFQEDKKAYYAQPATGPPYGISYGPRDTYTERNFPDPGSYNHGAMAPQAIHPPPSHARPAARDRDPNVRDNWIHHDHNRHR
ncbi:hypothetical protein EPUL_002464 [Erysiphe pulchra]|uniref:Transcription factor RfeG n=1 Tax=Erysiphe pulchra TaxID=225359 RepID=A0A2S4PXF2_9PEZI|nr:hypothetical protein EPUL_002464 [Erysiphe pulchra]